MQHQSNIQKYSQHQTIKILPQQIQFLNLLHLNVLELEDYIQKELEENPFLEVNTETEFQVSPADQDSVQEEQFKDDDNMDDQFEFRSLDDELPDYNTKIENGYESDEPWQSPAVQPTDIREELKNQCNFLLIDERTQSLCSYIIDSLDDSGLLPTSLDVLADDISFSKNIFYTDQEMEGALHIVQRLDPPGIGARNLRECLLLQMERHESNGIEVALPVLLVTDFMDVLGTHEYEVIKRQLRVSDEALRQAVAYIKDLNPRPLRGFSEAGNFNNTITPEYVIEIEGNDIFVTLANGRAEILRLSEGFDALLKKTNDKKAEQFIRKKMEDANWLIEALRQRDDTMLRVIRVIVLLQRDFFLSGNIKALQPMILRDVAEYVGLDISTVSRVTSSKYAQSPFGIIGLKALFTHTFAGQDGKEINNQDVQDCLTEIISNENKSSPLNDTEICSQLAERGFPVARRTVAKYREQRNIPIAPLRRNV
jgi:RNA polymerase sigma-54 factor